MGRSITRGTVDAGERSQYPILAIVKPRGCVAELVFLWFFFFFSSRRRHTRLTCDWSSDVCSSDLIGEGDFEELVRAFAHGGGVEEGAGGGGLRAQCIFHHRHPRACPGAPRAATAPEIGRASCRERVESAVVAEAVTEKVLAVGTKK